MEMQVPGARIYFSEEDEKDIAAKIEEILTTSLRAYGGAPCDSLRTMTGTVSGES